MADICDLAQDHYEKTMLQTLANAALLAKSPAVASTGYCLSCDEPLVAKSNPRFCNVDCRDDYDDAQRRNTRRV